MEPTSDHQDDLFFQLGLALLELLDRPLDLELEHPTCTAGLVLNGTLLRAFDSPAQADLSITIGAHTITIRPSCLKAISINRDTSFGNPIQSLHLLLADNFFLHVKPQHIQPTNSSQ
jgi:hypothetical protein